VKRKEEEEKERGVSAWDDNGQFGRTSATSSVLF